MMPLQGITLVLWNQGNFYDSVTKWRSSCCTLIIDQWQTEAGTRCCSSFFSSCQLLQAHASARLNIPKVDDLVLPSWARLYPEMLDKGKCSCSMQVILASSCALYLRYFWHHSSALSLKWCAISRSCFTLLWSSAFFSLWQECSCELPWDSEGSSEGASQGARSLASRWQPANGSPSALFSAVVTATSSAVQVWHPLADQHNWRQFEVLLPYLCCIPAIKAGACWTFSPSFLTTFQGKNGQCLRNQKNST